MSQDRYITEVMRHPENQQHYRKLSRDPTELFSKEIKATPREMVSHHSINKDPDNRKASGFYILPKIHKPGNQGRPIISSSGAPTERMSHFVHYHLAPLVKQIPSNVRDTTDFLERLQNMPILLQETLLVTRDEKSLYTNIPHSKGIEACRIALNTRKVLQPPTKNLVHLIEQILTKDNFTFAGEYYLQI